MLKKQNGITLIALIITIIVMLILVGVTVNIALNGGLFTKADDAKESTQLAMDKEELQIEIVTAYDEDNKGVDLETLKENLVKKGWTDITISGDGLTLTCTSPKGNTFTIDGKGKVEEVPKNDDDEDDDDIIVTDNSSELEKYFFDANGEGKNGLITENEDLQILVFADDGNTIPNASTSIEFMKLEDGYMIVEYKGADYKIAITDSNVPTSGGNGEKITKLPNEVYPEEIAENEIKIKQYFTGYSGVGKQLYSLVDMEKSEIADSPVFRDNSIIENAADTIKIVGSGQGNVRIKYNEVIYVLEIDNNFMIHNAYKYEKTYPVAYSVNGNVLIIELPENEVIHRMFEGIHSIEEVDDINKIEGHEDEIVINEVGIKYSKVIVVNVDNYVPAVYCEDEDKWYLVTRGFSGEAGKVTQTINNNLTATLDTTTSKEDLEQMIQDAMNSN